MALKPGPWSANAWSKKGADEAHVWGHDDPPRTMASDPGTVESMIAKYVSGFPASHWRPANGKLLYTRYEKFPQLKKQAGMMILDRSGTAGNSVQFNVIMDMHDPKATIEAMKVALQGHIMFLFGSSGQEAIYETSKDTNENVKKGDHASEWDIIFRIAKLGSFKMGLTKNGDLVICMGFHRLQICVRNV